MLTLTNAEIINASPLLLADLVGKANEGTATTVVSREYRNLEEEDIVGAYICFIGGSHKGQDRIITSYTTTGGVGTFGFDALDSPVGETDVFAILFVNYLAGAERASEIIESDLLKKGYELQYFTNEAQLKELHLNKTVSHICQSKMQNANTDDTYFVNYEIFEERYQRELSTLIADYDADENGTISESEELTPVGQVILRR